MNRLAALSSILFLFILSGSAQALTVCASGYDSTSIPSGGYIGNAWIVKPGTYIQSDTAVVGGTLVAKDPDPTKTIIDAMGAVGGSGVPLPVFRSVDDATIMGFTIRGGAAGIQTQGSAAVTLAKMLIEDNSNSEVALGAKGGITGTGNVTIIISKSGNL